MSSEQERRDEPTHRSLEYFYYIVAACGSKNTTNKRADAIRTPFTWSANSVGTSNAEFQKVVLQTADSYAEKLRVRK